MSTTIPTRFRPDLIITETQRVGEQTKSYFIKNPISGETFLLKEEELFICRLLNGSSDSQQIISSFNEAFHKILTEEDLQNFIGQINELGLLEQVLTLTDNRGGITRQDTSEAQSSPTANDEDSEFTELRFVLYNPEHIFNFLAAVTRPFHLIFVAITWLLIPGFFVALQLFFRQQKLFFYDLTSIDKELNYICSFLFSLISVNIFSRIVAGAVFAHFGGQVKELGIRLHFGILPRFFINRYGLRKTPRSVKLWTYCSSPAARAFIFIVGIIGWYSLRGTGTQLSYWLAMMGQVGLVSFLLITLPLRQSDVFKWVTTYFNLSPHLFQEAFYILLAKLKFRPLPNTISEGKQWVLLVYASALILVWVYLALSIVPDLTIKLESIFPGILGRATGYIVLFLVIIAFLRWLAFVIPEVTRINPQKTTTSSTSTSLGKPKSTKDTIFKSISNFLSNQWIKLAVLFCLAVILCLPFSYAPGGELQLLPPTQQQIQAPVEGKITQVFFNGGDGQRIAKRTIVASMVSTDIENKIQNLQENIKEQQANIEKKQAELSKLIKGPINEEIAVAEAQVGIIQNEVFAVETRLRAAIDEVEIARKGWQKAKTQAQYSGASAARQEILYREGGLARESYEEEKKKYEIDLIQIEEAQQTIGIKKKNVNEMYQTLAAKKDSLRQARAQLTLLLTGSRKEDIEAARQEVKAAQAELQRLRKELLYQEAQKKSTRLVMPFDGYLVDSYLQQKIGTYLKPGQKFAVVQDSNQLFGEIQVPEYDAGEIEIGDLAEVKLLLYPNNPFSGKVVSIEPATKVETDSKADPNSAMQSDITQTNRVFKVIIDLANSPQTLKTGMSGYAKIDAGKKPLFVLLTRPLVRFIQIEVWSWLP
ncbi:efflux RND transporter periplasmic adaptor subunit [Sphaerospermopsis aphanizomenoides BCCUSP55]|uniref:HlyD family secretion protein n=1 Tax=Sphaerospermopsis aphanizomenoides TaxID=459663 RepID=UPI00190632D3|nr:efflux RND transporter periplasmic adaptor subunit [Sphaerospermopsis aphanizomenoides]MBK1989423.1 efflux RND transporter periplasmic adaptor subunit [Sphaerospermopsis aphanizomenoides BCCUSP55]